MLSDETMTLPVRQAVAHWIREAADMLGLKDWRFEVLAAPPVDASSFASCLPLYGRKQATIRVRAFVFDEPDDVVAHSLVHELLHCHHGELMEQAEAVAQGHLGAVEPVIRLHIEHMVDAMATVLVDNLDLPSLEPIWDALASQPDPVPVV